MTKGPGNLFTQLQYFESEIKRLEAKIHSMESDFSKMIQVERNHIIRVKNSEEISDDFINSGRGYYDLTPEKAWKHYCNPDFDFILVDVSNHLPDEQKISEAIHIPWDKFKERYFEISSQTAPIFIISEDGTKSILACEFLNRRGFYNCNNISGGHKFWLGHKLSKTNQKTA